MITRKDLQCIIDRIVYSNQDNELIIHIGKVHHQLILNTNRLEVTICDLKLRQIRSCDEYCTNRKSH